MTKLNARRFKAKYGSHPVVLVKIWLDLKKFGLVNGTNNNPDIFKMFLGSQYLLKCYPTREEVASFLQCHENTA